MLCWHQHSGSKVSAQYPAYQLYRLAPHCIALPRILKKSGNLISIIALKAAVGLWITRGQQMVRG
jgi:hypothetical protein